MNKYSELTDKQVEKLIDQLKKTPTDFGLYIDEYCTSWKHTGPLIYELTKDGEWLFTLCKDQVRFDGELDYYEVREKPTLRAICECILLINDRSE